MQTLFFPAAAMALWTLTIGLFMFLNRLGVVRSRSVKLSYFRVFSTPAGQEQLPERMVQFSRHFINLFEVPVLFYAVCLFGMILGHGTDKGMLNTGWAFVALRIAHSLIHLTYNKVNHRLIPFLLSTLVVAAMWLKLLIGQLTY